MTFIALFNYVVGQSVQLHTRRPGSGFRLMVSGAALMAGLAASSSAMAQCADNGANARFTFTAANKRSMPSQINQFFPVGSGINSLTSIIDTTNTAFITNTSAFVSAPGNPAPDQQGGGVWARGIGGNVETKTQSTFSSVVVPTNPPTITSPVNCNVDVKQDFGGFQVGQDISILNNRFIGGNLHFGVTAGEVETKARDASPGNSATPSGSLSSNFEVPFAGVYASYTRGNLYADVQGRADFYQGEVNDPVNGGVFKQRLDARGYSVTGNIGYRFDLKDKYFIEPSIGGVLSKVTVDQFDVAGTFLNTPNGVSLPGSVKIGDIDGALGRVGVRAGKTLTSDDGQYIAQPFVSVNVFNEFAGNVNTSLKTQFAQVIPGFDPAQDISGTVKTTRVGTYGQFGVGSTFQLANSGWLGYGRIDYRTGDHLEGLTVNGGLRYSFAPNETPIESYKDGPREADLATYNWTGFYVGGLAGGVRGKNDELLDGVARLTPDYAGLLVGGQVGYNYQIGRIVLGVEAEDAFSNARGVTSCPSLFLVSCQDNLNNLGSVTGRIGYTWGRALFYGKGGFAFGEIDLLGHENQGPPNLTTTSQWATGWTAGGGMEFALTDKWSAKAEYLHHDLGTENFNFNNGENIKASTSGDSVKVGVNYHVTPMIEPSLK